MHIYLQQYDVVESNVQKSHSSWKNPWKLFTKSQAWTLPVFKEQDLICIFMSTVILLLCHLIFFLFQETMTKLCFLMKSKNTENIHHKWGFVLHADDLTQKIQLWKFKSYSFKTVLLKIFPRWESIREWKYPSINTKIFRASTPL